MVIAIDGPAGCGKSTVARAIAEKTGFLFLNSGSFYRGITSEYIRITTKPPRMGRAAFSDTVHGRPRRAGARHPVGIPGYHAAALDEVALVSLAAGMAMDYFDGRLVIDNRDVEADLHTDAVDALVSQISAFPAIRDIVNGHIRSVAADKDVVCEGRDMCTVVFPDADYQFYLDADIDVQARRRFDQGVSGLSLEEIKAAIMKRDENDKKKAVGALKKAEKAEYIDTTHLTISEVCAIILDKITLKEVRVHYG